MRVRYPFRTAVVVALALGFVVALAGAALADETCNSPYVTKLIKGQEDYVYVWALGVEGLGDGSDKLVTVDVNPASKTYGKVLHQAPWARAARRTTWASPTIAAGSGRAGWRAATSTSSTSRPTPQSRSS